MMRRFAEASGRALQRHPERVTTHMGTHCTTERVYSRPNTAYQGVDRDGGHSDESGRRPDIPVDPKDRATFESSSFEHCSAVFRRAELAKCYFE